MESAAIGGAAHLVNFLGTDTVPSLVMAKEYYNTPIAGFSIPAAEHSTITSWGKTEELIAFNNMLEQFPEGLVAVVSDSYDIYNACENLWGTILKNKVMNRNGTLVIRPDSGDPCTVVMKCLEILGEKFGTTINDKGYKVLDPHVRLIQGDGVNQNSIHQILTVMDENKWSIDNIAFGMGGALLQKLNRDTQKFAFKCSWTQQDGKELNVSKSPVTDQGKNSKAGKLALFKTNTKTFVTNNDTDNPNNVLRTVFLNGELLIDESLEEIRERTKNP
jgi:nicotinamide phosphoribosyltransferase